MQKQRFQKVLWVLIILTLMLAVGCPSQSRKPGAEKKPEVQGGKEPTISLYIKESGQKKDIRLEEYLLGVVAAEMEPSWPKEALAAQAILARTFTMKKIQEGGVKKHGTDASTDVEEFQAYDPSRVNDRVEEAVQSTRGEVVTYDGGYINGWFFADGGGRTAASAEEGLAYKNEPAPYIKSVTDPGFDITEPENKAWTATFSLDEVRRAMQEKTGQDPGSITSAKITAKGPSGRATTVQVGSVTASAPAIRLALGSEKMRSTLLDRFEVTGEKLIISGKGYGHGVGMSQWGAKALAGQGKSPEEIVKYFFKNVKIETVWK